MKKVKFLIAAMLSSTMIFMSCANSPSDSSSDENNSLNAEKRALYNSALLNTSWKAMSTSYDDAVYADTIVFKENEIIYGGTSYSIKNSDLHFSSEGGKYKSGSSYSLAVVFNDIIWKMSPGKAWDPNSKTFDSSMKVLKFANMNWNWCMPYSKVSSSDSSSSSESSSETVTVSGKYTINQAKGSTINFDNDNWTFKYNSSSKNGTYSQSNNEITIKYSIGSVNASAVFTVSKDGDNVKLTGKSGDIQTIVASAFMITDSTALSNGVVTLTANN